MAHRRTYSHHLDMDKISFDTPPLTPPLAVFNQFQFDNAPARKTKQYWQRTTFLALFALVLVSGYVILVSQPTLSPIAMQGDDSRSLTGLAAQRLSRLSAEAYRLAASSHRKRPKGSATSSSQAEASTDTLPPLQLTPEQELAAVTSFLASLPQNVIPSNVNPSLPIDPQLVLDFDTRSPQAIAEVAQLEHDAWIRYPVVLYSKMHSPISRELEKSLLELNLLPGPAIIPVEYRPDEDVLKPLLHRLTGTDELPLLLVGGKVIGTAQEVRYMHSKGDLARAISKAGAIVDGAKKKKGRKH